MKAKKIAMGGVMAALAVVIMCMGGLIPVATFVCPVICCILLQLISGILGNKMCWVWYVTVSILAVLIGPDKEAAAVFVFLGYYPIIRRYFPQNILGWLLKALYFNASIFVMYWLMIRILGIDQLSDAYAGLSAVMLVVLVLLGNVTFFMLDRLLVVIKRRFI